MKPDFTLNEWKRILEHTQQDIDFMDGMAKYGFSCEHDDMKRMILQDLINHGYLYHYAGNYHRKPNT